MPTTETNSNLVICSDALKKIGVLAIDEVATADDFDTALRALGRMLKAWQAKGYRLWTVTSESIPATTSALHSLTDLRPIDIQSIRVKRSGVETPMIAMTRNEYDTLPVKASTGLPTQYYFDRQRDTSGFYVWPLFGSVSSETFEVTYIREINDPVADEQVDVPSEWYDAVVYGLAARLSDDYSINHPNLVARAESELRDAMAFDVEDSVYFVGGF